MLVSYVSSTLVKSFDGLGEGAIVAEVGLLPATEADAGRLTGSVEKKRKKYYSNFIKFTVCKKNNNKNSVNS